MRSSSSSNQTEKIDFIICCIILVTSTQAVEIFGILLFLYLLYKRSKLTEENEIKSFIEKFGTFFEEFKSDGIKDWLFYFIYILRRLMINVSYQFIDDGVFQLSISIMFSLSVRFNQIPLYVLTVRGFKTSIYNVYHFFNEILIGIYHAVILVSLINGVADKSEELTDICMKIILSAWILNMVISMSNTVKMVVDKIKDILAKRRLKKTEDKYKTRTAPEPIDDDCKVAELE